MNNTFGDYLLQFAYSVDIVTIDILAPFRFQLTVSRKPLVVIG